MPPVAVPLPMLDPEQTRVLLLQLLEAPSLVHLHPPKLLPPPVVRLLADPEFPAHHPHRLTVRQTDLRLPQCRFLVDVGDGADPLDGRPPTDTTIKQFAKTYVQDYAKGAKKTWRGDERRLEKHVVPALGSKTSFTFGRSGGSVPERGFPCLRSRVTEAPGIVRRLQTLQENHHDHLDLRRSVLLLYTDALRGASWSRRSTRMRRRSP